MQSIPRLACVAISFALALASQFGTPRAQTYAAGVDYKAGELVLTFKPEYMPAQNEVTLSPPSFGVSPLDAMLSAIQATSISKVVPSYEAVSRLERQFLVTYTEEDDPLELIGEFAALEYFESVAANRLWWFELQGTERAVPGDTTLFAQQWYLDNSDVGDKSDIDAPEAWAIERGDPNLVVGIYDSGTMVDPCTGTNWRLHSDFNHLFVPGEDKFPFNILTQADFLNDTVDDDSDGFLGNVIGVNVGDGCDPLLCTDQTPLTIWRPLPQNWIVGTSFPNLECPGASASWDVVGFHTHGVRVGAIAVAKWDGLKKNHPEDLDPTHKDIVGVANNCKVYNARFRCPTGDAQAAAALVALAEHCSVINMSFGQREYDLFSGFSNSFKDAVEKVTSDPSYDCVLVAATGNSGLGNDIIYPARFDSVLAVGAISRYDLNDAPNPQRVDYSNYSEDEYLVDVVAPTETRPNLSVGIKTDSHSSCSGPPCGGGDFGPACSPTETTTDSQEGTSFAAPQVAGVAALIRSRFPGLSQSQVKQRIKRSAQHYWGTRPTYEHGYGKVNAYRALTEWGKISSSVTWNVSGTRDGKYYVSGDITIENEGSLTIGPGVFIKVAPDHEAAGTDPTKVRIIVKDGGALYINGSEGAPVVFESFNEGPAGQTDWSGIEFQEGSSGAIAHAVFRNADRALELYTPMILQNVTIENGGTGIEHYEDLIISDSNIHDLAGSGIIIRGGELTASNVEISECGSYGISDALAHGRVLIEDCVIFDLGGNGIGLTWPATTIAISGTTIDNAGDTGILLGQPASVIGCGIQGCDIGIWFITSGSVSIRESTISNNTTAGIYVVGSANVIIDENVITSSAVGILLNGSNSAFIRNSQVTGHGTAVAAMNDANADIGVASSGTGCDAAGPNIGNNSIHTNTNYNVSNISPSISIMAEGNWWNSNPPKASKFYGNVDRTPYLCSAPSPSAPAEDSEPARDDKSQSRIPTHYGLGASKPNPFNPTTTMTFDVPSPGGVVEISIFDVRGTRIRTLVQGYRGPGVHFATWTGESDKGDSVASGVYFVRMNARAFTQTRKLVLLK